MVIPFVVPEILGGGDQMPLSCQKRQMRLSVKGLVTNQAIYSTLSLEMYHFLVHNSNTP